MSPAHSAGKEGSWDRSFTPQGRDVTAMQSLGRLRSPEDASSPYGATGASVT